MGNSRIIKFRAWNTIVKRCQFFTLPEIEIQKGKIQWQNLKIDQYTGLKDKNGVEIYEGDVVYYDNGTEAQVVFKDGGFCGYDGYSSNSDEAYLKLNPDDSPFASKEYEIEVIGNVHQNKDK